MFKKTKEKEEVKPEHIPMPSSKEEIDAAVEILTDAILLGQLTGKYTTPYGVLAVVHGPITSASSDYLNPMLNSYRPTFYPDLVSEMTFKTMEEINEEKRLALESRVKSKRATIEKDVAELEKLSKELGELT